MFQAKDVGNERSRMGELCRHILRRLGGWKGNRDGTACGLEEGDQPDDQASNRTTSRPAAAPDAPLF